jgi:hypothetical protein
MKITSDIKMAIESACAWHGGHIGLARLIGVNNSAITKYLNGDIKTVKHETWDRMYPHIEQFLKRDQSSPAPLPQKAAPPGMKSETLSDDEREFIEKYRTDKALALIISEWYSAPESIRKKVLIEILQNAGNKEESGDPTVQ